MKRKRSFISAKQMRSYALEARRLVAAAERYKSTPFGAALAGVALIRNAVAAMGGESSWWCKLITSTKENPLEEFRVEDSKDEIVAPWTEVEDQIVAPWTDDQVAALNRYRHAVRHADGSECILIATRDGWTKCGGGHVIQSWAWRFMFEP